jgi:hypothetical protein
VTSEKAGKLGATTPLCNILARRRRARMTRSDGRLRARRFELGARGRTRQGPVATYFSSTGKKFVIGETTRRHGPHLFPPLFSRQVAKTSTPKKAAAPKVKAAKIAKASPIRKVAKKTVKDPIPFLFPRLI